MHTEELKQLAIDCLNDMKAIDISVMDVHSITHITDYMIICSGTSSRHVKSLSENLVIKAKANRLKHIRMESDSNFEWVLVDLGDVIVHVMLPNARAFYNLEELWEPIREMRGQKSD